MQEQASQIAADVLFPAAMDTDASDRIPSGHLDLLAAEGFYGLAGPVGQAGSQAESGSPAGSGAGIDIAAFCRVIEILAGGCLATTFVWLQHHGAVRAASSAPSRLRSEWLGPLCGGVHRSGLALGGAQPGPPLLRATAAPGGYLLDGTSPWVTGWGMIDTLLVAARDDQDNVVQALLPLPAVPGGTLSVELFRLVAVNASCTGSARFDGHFMADGQVTAVVPHREWLARDAMTLRANGSLALGVAGRCCAMIGASPLDPELTACRRDLDLATPEQMPAARAAAAELASRAAAALVTVHGSRAILAGQHAQRLAREALFLLVFASRPAIKAHLVSRLTGAAQAS